MPKRKGPAADEQAVNVTLYPVTERRIEDAVIALHSRGFAQNSSNILGGVILLFGDHFRGGIEAGERFSRQSHASGKARGMNSRERKLPVRCVLSRQALDKLDSIVEILKNKSYPERSSRSEVLDMLAHNYLDAYLKLHEPFGYQR